MGLLPGLPGLKRRSFTFLEALMAIGAMVVAVAAILGAFLSSSNLRMFSENFTIGINACQKELERIRFRYERDTDPQRQLTFLELLEDYDSTTGKGINGKPFYVYDEEGTLRDDFKGVIISEDSSEGDGLLVTITARLAFRVGNRIIGGDSELNPLDDTPCQLSTVIVRIE